ncbi:hypothetical protein O7627_10695 [Solwaraspora sp. WMMD1047]|uniref:hypothetical protein n=1 Tax=Solwaraspora sp. WMMD1047 TaxID=3016102 RepID=UPI0024171944|nr:hypothetical protein [Solwaraspora sp. WMMD1047]MDG4829769.1 hypothetical protein [Solwaraspora sp. WMMD1047]
MEADDEVMKVLDTPTRPAPWYRNRFVWVAVILLVVSTGAFVLVSRLGSASGEPTDLRGQIAARMLTVLEEIDPAQHEGHGEHLTGTDSADAPVICGVHVYGFEPADATTLPEVDRVYGFHLCGIAEQQRPWDWAVKLAGPVILGMESDPPTVQVAEATETVGFRDRVRQLFPPEYHEAVFTEALDPEDMLELRRRYDAAAGV